MSLTAHLNARVGPVYDWFSSRLPNTRQLCVETNRQLRGGGSNLPCAVPATPGSDSAVAAMAVEYLLAVHLRDGGFKRMPAAKGAAVLASMAPDVGASVVDVEAEAARRLSEFRVCGAAPGGSGWEEMLAISIVMARFEQLYRAGSMLNPVTYMPILQPFSDLADLGHRLASAETFADLDRMGRATIDDLSCLAECEELEFGAEFAQSELLGGADCDLIADGALIELKSLGGKTGLKRRDLWQLAGYLLADTDDRYWVERCEFVALRRRRSCGWEAWEFLDRMAADGLQGRALEDWWSDFAEMLDAYRRRREQRLRARRARRQRARLVAAQNSVAGDLPF